MAEYTSKAVRHRFKCTEDDFKSAYTRTFYYESPLTQPLYRARIKTASSDTACGKNIPPLDYTSIYNQVYKDKYAGYQPNFYGRSSVGRPSHLKFLHEKYAREIIQPIKPGLTSTGLTYARSNKSIFTPEQLSHGSPVDDATCSITTFGKGDFPAITVNEPSYHKHLDNFVGTTQMTHVDFLPRDREIANNKKTDANDDGFKIKKIGRKDSYFPLVMAPFPKTSPLVPYNAYNTAYNSDYNHVARRLILWQPKVRFPVLFKSTRKELTATPTCSCTDGNSHVD